MSVSFYTQNISYMRVSIHLSIMWYSIHWSGIEFWYINLIYLYLFIVLHKTQFLITCFNHLHISDATGSRSYLQIIISNYILNVSHREVGVQYEQDNRPY